MEAVALGYTGVTSYLGPGVRGPWGGALNISRADCRRKAPGEQAFVRHRSSWRGVAIVGTGRSSSGTAGMPGT